MSRLQNLAATLCPGSDGDPCGNCRDVAASILADPGPLLEALAEAGVLREERAIDKPGMRGINPQRRYVTEWRPTDARP